MYRSQTSSPGIVSSMMDDWRGAWRPVSGNGHLLQAGLNFFVSRHADGDFRPADKEGQVYLGRRYMFYGFLDERLTGAA